MKFKIGFACEPNEDQPMPVTSADRPRTLVPRKSVVQVRFPEWSRDLAYYNDRFDLKVGDLVFVDGKLAGQQGRVTQVSYNFKIKLADYKRVIAVADTRVTGQLFFADSHFVAFDPHVLPADKVAGWFLPPVPEDEETVSGSDDSSFPLSDLKQMDITPTVAQRGRDYYVENRVRYLTLQGDRGYAIVEGTRPYEIEFEYRDGQIRDLVCSCFCSGVCKHQFAAMLQLRDILEKIEKDYADQYRRTGCFAAIFKPTLFQFAVDGSDVGSITLN